MALSAKNAGTWKPMKVAFSKLSGAWVQAKGLWVRSGGVYHLQGGALVQVNIGGDLNPICYYDGPPFGAESSCTAVTTLTAVPIYGWPALSYQWQRKSGTSWVNIGGNSPTINLAGGDGTYGDSVTVRVIVTDSTGATATSPETLVTFTQQNQSEIS